jgi:hypothetical protein
MATELPPDAPDAAIPLMHRRATANIMIINTIMHRKGIRQNQIHVSFP